MPIMGNSVMLKADFRGITPTSVTVTLYDDEENIFAGPFTLDASNIEDVGKYFYWYTIPKTTGRLYYEFCGVVDGRNILNRKILPRRWYNR